MVNGLAEGFNQLGCFARALQGSISDQELFHICKSLSINLVFQINKSRSLNFELPKNVRWISWYQDIFPSDVEAFGENFKQDDIIYTLGDPRVLGIKSDSPYHRGTLFTGVSDSVLNHRPKFRASLVDFSLCGYIPSPYVPNKDLRKDLIWYVKRQMGNIPLFRRSSLYSAALSILFKNKLPLNYIPYSAQVEIKLIVESIYRPLRGELDINELYGALNNVQSLFSSKNKKKIPIEFGQKDGKIGLLSKIFQPYDRLENGALNTTDLLKKMLNFRSSLSEFTEYSEITKAINYFSQTYPRLIDRRFLIDNILEISKSLELYGPGWDSHDVYRPYYKGVLNIESDLLDVYCNSRINLANNTHGIGMHSRNLECMAVGGFLLIHKSANDTLDGGIAKFFESDIDFGTYVPENLKDKANFWLVNKNLRAKASRSASRKIREGHTWRHRASQIIKDLGD